MTYSYMPWLIHAYYITHSYVAWLIHMCDMTRQQPARQIITLNIGGMTWRIRTRHDLFICDMTHSQVRHDSQVARAPNQDIEYWRCVLPVAPCICAPSDARHALAWIYICMSAYSFACIHIYTIVYEHVYICIYMCVWIYIYIHICIHMNMYMYKYICM